MPDANAAVCCRQCLQPVHHSGTGMRCTNENCAQFVEDHGELGAGERTVRRPRTEVSADGE